MRRGQPIRIALHETKIKYRYFEEPTQYQIREDRKCIWLQKVCIWILNKLKAYAKKTEQTFETITVYPETVLETVFKTREYIYEELGGKPSVMFIGAKDYSEMMNEPAIRQVIRFKTSYHYNRYGEHTIMDLDVIIIPYMEGVLVV